MKVGDKCVVVTDRDGTHSHSKGTIVEIMLIGNKEIDPEPYYCQTIAGNTCYWYGDQDLEVIEREGMI